MSSPRTLRGRFTLVGTAIAALAIAVLTVAFNLALGRSVDADATTRLRTQAAAGASAVAVRYGRVRVLESPYDAGLDRQVWVFAGTRAVERPPAGPALQAAARALAGSSHVRRDLPDQRYRLYSLALTAGGRRVGTVVTGLSLAAYERTRDLALIASLGLAGLLLAAVSGLTWVLVGRALSPVRDMTRSAASWSAHGDEQRFGVASRPDELGELAATFDALLDQVAASLRHEQRLSSELSHELRTPLARITAEVELLQRRERSAPERAQAHAAIGRSAQQMSGILETLMAAARAHAGLDAGHCDVAAVLEEVARQWPPGGVRLGTRVSGPAVTAGVERDVLERILAPLLDNARRYARTRVQVSAGAAHGRVLVTVSDDGPGVPEEALEHVFEPGARLEGVEDGHGGAGLGLALSRRLARAAGGDVRARRAGPAGSAFCVELPA